MSTETSAPEEELPSTVTATDRPIIDPKEVIAEVLAAKAQSASLVNEIAEQNRLAASQVAEIQEKLAEIDAAKSNIATEVTAAHSSTETTQQLAEDAKKSVSDANALVSSLQTSITHLGEQGAQASGIIESIRATAAIATDAVSRIEALKVQVEQDAQVAAQRSQHIEDGRQYVDARRAEIDTLSNQAQQSATGAEAQLQAVRAINDNVTNLQANVQSLQISAEQSARTTQSLHAQSESYAAAAKKLADVASDTEQRIAAYEKRMTELTEEAASRLKTIESLLPGATSAGLASAFGQRRSFYKWPQRFWQAVFICSVLSLLAFATKLPDIAIDPTLSWNKLGMSLLHRLPFALPLIWLAIHAAHKAALAQRVEEDYAFKETISRSFEGYRREMAELEGKVAADSPLGLLCSGTLSTIAQHPGAIYEKHPLAKTPLNSLTETVVPIAEAAGKLPVPKTPTLPNS